VVKYEVEIDEVRSFWFEVEAESEEEAIEKAHKLLNGDGREDGFMDCDTKTTVHDPEIKKENER